MVRSYALQKNTLKDAKYVSWLHDASAGDELSVIVKIFRIHAGKGSLLVAFWIHNLLATVSQGAHLFQGVFARPGVGLAKKVDAPLLSCTP